MHRSLAVNAEICGVRGVQRHCSTRVHIRQDGWNFNFRRTKAYGMSPSSWSCSDFSCCESVGVGSKESGEGSRTRVWGLVRFLIMVCTESEPEFAVNLLPVLCPTPTASIDLRTSCTTPRCPWLRGRPTRSRTRAHSRGTRAHRTVLGVQQTLEEIL